MSDVLDELTSGASANIGLTVHNLGGDLFDELAIKDRKPGELSDVMKNQAVTDSRREMAGTLNDDLTAYERFMVPAGRGLHTIGRAVGLVEPEDPAVTQAIQPLVDESGTAMAGEIVGEAALFLPLGPLTAAIKSILPRIAVGAGIGALEGGAIIKGKGGDPMATAAGAGVGGTIGGAVEAIVPMFGRLVSSLFHRLGRKPTGPLLTVEGTPSVEFQVALEQTGTTFEDLAQDAFAKVNQQGVNPEQAARAARFESQGIPASKGDITQDFAQQATEQRLMTSASADAGAPFRQQRLAQSNAFVGKVNELVDGLGIPDETGRTVKEALTGRKSMLRAEKNRFYDEALKAAPEMRNIPLIGDDIIMSLPDPAKARRLGRIAGSQMEAVDDLLVEFGLDTSKEAVEAFAKSGGDVTPLTLGNFEDFRAALNQIERADTTGASSVVIGPIKNALDAEVLALDKGIKGLGVTDPTILDTLKQARARVKTLKTEFSKESITGRLINVKRDGVTPVIDASKVANELLRPGAPIENLQRTITSLQNAGEKGVGAIRNLRAATVLNALEASLKATGRKIDSQPTFGGNQFAKYLDSLGDAKLKVLFGEDKASLNALKNFKQTALDVEATNMARPMGSAAVNMDVIRKLGEMIGATKGLGVITSFFKLAVKPGADTRATQKAIKASPEMTRVAGMLEREFPALASALGVAGVLAIGDNNNE